MKKQHQKRTNVGISAASIRRSHSILLRTCLICLASIPGQALLAQDSKQDDPKQSYTLDEIFAGKLPQSVDDLKAMQEHFRELAKRLKPATVALRVGQSQGSGVIVSRDGYLLTAAHVIGKPGQEFDVLFEDGSRAKAKSLGLNHSLDSGMAKIVEEGNWPYLDLGVSESLKRGQWVMSIGHPGGFDKLRGPVVRVGRLTYNSQSVLVSDCTLVGGDSGGPLFDMDGNIVGIHSRIGGPIESNMHVPVDVFMNEWDKYEEGKEIGRSRNRSTRPTVDPGFRVDTKLKITQVKPNGEKAGLKVGDVIKKFNGIKIKSRTEMAPGLLMLRKEKPFKVTVERDGKELTLEITPTG